MLIGNSNSVNKKLVDEISKIYPITFVDATNFVEHPLEVNSSLPRIIIVNLMDVASNERDLFALIKNTYPDRKLLGLHCFKSQNMIQNVLDSGYDGYLSIFDFSNEFSEIINKLGVLV
ncbi:MAG: hypothetical protein BM564_01020 [Bacteroidetes bacterium MedPE-SWsnd-G2]|nr:MAG: hypothetical protein BM564_01020 [Bacteroidetes bacterium MedPE-SWsnd-G2]